MVLIKMKVLTATVNNPEFIEIQYYTLKKYLKGEYEFIVFNDAKPFPDYSNSGDITIRKRIQEVCTRLGIQCIDILNEHHINNQSAAQRCADAMNVMLKYQLEYPDQYLVIDSDMFLIADLNPSKYLNYDCAIVLQERLNRSIQYFWNGLFYFDTTRMKNTNLLNWNPCRQCDVGGMMQKWFKLQMEGHLIPTDTQLRWNKTNYHTSNTYFIRHLWSLTWNTTEAPESIRDNSKLIEYFKTDPRNENGKFFCEIYDDVFLHYRAGGNWRGEGSNFHQNRTELLKQILTQDN